MTGLTAELARFASDPPVKAVPAEVLPLIRNGFIDTCATLLAGRHEPVVAVLQQYCKGRLSGQGESSVLLGDERTDAATAALINGTAAHALDYDDVALGGHPSTVLVPALLAEGEAVGASGADLLRAYLVGYEVWAELIARDPDPHHVKGWHPTAVFGTVAAAAAVACLRRVGTEVACQAIALAASMAGGVVANFGSMTKPFHAGRAASAGIESVRLALLGMSASIDALEHPAGFLQALSPKGQVDLNSPVVGLGETLRLRESGLNIKKYPVCYALHRVIDGMLDLVAKERVSADQVGQVNVRLGKTQAAMLRNHSPQTGLEAKFSLEFAMASAMITREVGLEQLTDAFVRTPEVQRAMTLVTAETVDTVCPVEPFLAYADGVTVTLKDGRTLDSGDIRFARGSSRLPLSHDELARKFSQCARIGRYDDAPLLLESLMGLEQLPEVRTLTRRHR